MGQRVQHGDTNAIVVLHRPPDEVGADESGPSCDYNVSQVLLNHAVSNFCCSLRLVVLDASAFCFGLCKRDELFAQ